MMMIGKADANFWMRSWIVVVVVLSVMLVAVGSVRGEEEGETGETGERPNIAKMRVKQLKSELKSRGLNCKGCVSKREFVELLEEHWEDPIVEVEEAPSTFDPSTLDIDSILKSMSGRSAEEEAMYEALERQGIKIQRPDDSRSRLEEMLRKMKQGGGGGGGEDHEDL